MATTRIMPLHVGKGRTESRAISDIIDYVANPKKTDNGRLILAVSNSVWRLPALWCRSPLSSWPMNPPAIWTAKPAPMYWDF